MQRPAFCKSTYSDKVDSIGDFNGSQIVTMCKGVISNLGNSIGFSAYSKRG